MEATVSKAEYDELKAENNVLRHRLEQLERLIFAAKSERFAPASTPEQMELFEQAAAAGAQEVEKQKITYERTKKKAHPGRTKLPVRREIIEPEEDTSDMVKIGEEITGKVDYTPGTLEIVEYVRPKYARPEAEQTDDKPAIVIALVPDQVIPKGIPGAGLLTHIAVSKYIDHLPFYRQIGMFNRDHGWAIHKSTINDWFAAVCTLLEPLYGVLRKNVLDTNYLQGDESRILVLERGKDQPKKETSKKLKSGAKRHLGYMWVFRNPVSGNVFFVYRTGRGANVLHETLADFTGLLQSDGYSAYTSYVKKHDVELVSCLAHIRRKFSDAQKNHRSIAEMALSVIQYLYRVEARCRERKFTPDQRLVMRRRVSRPVYEALLDWVNYKQRNNLTKGDIGKALLYAKNHLPRLRHYLEDGRIEIDNNQIENKIRPLALGRKNYMFAGSNKGAERAAMMYSFFASCKANEVNPSDWLRDVLVRIGSHKVNQLKALLPAQWGEERERGM
ncbi:MAG: IS66 family transposase [Lewinella sp.]|nr:IS66 family transposase [Lewinella sp.]